MKAAIAFTLALTIGLLSPLLLAEPATGGRFSLEGGPVTGGGQSTGGTFTVTGGAGEAATGPLTGGKFVARESTAHLKRYFEMLFNKK